MNSTKLLKTITILALLAILVALIASCAAPAVSSESHTGVPNQASDSSVYVYHDKQRGVTCWIYYGYQQGGISCLPDKSFE